MEKSLQLISVGKKMVSSIITSRVRENVKIKLEAECKSKNVTLNTLIGQILSKHVDWDRFTEDVGFTFMSKVDLKTIFDSITEKQIEKIAQTQGKDSMKNTIDFIQGEFNFENFIRILDLWIGASNVPFRHISTVDSEKFIVKHDLGKNWSLYLITLVETISWDLNYRISKKNINRQNISFEIKKVN